MQSRFQRTLSREGPYYALILPAVVVVFIFSYIPLYGLVIAFQRYNVARGFSSPWIGFANFRQIFSQVQFTRTISNTIFIAVMKIIGGIIVPVTISLMLNEIRNIRVERFFQTLVYLPYFLSWVILSGVFIDMLSLDGIMNKGVMLSDSSPSSSWGTRSSFPG